MLLKHEQYEGKNKINLQLHNKMFKTLIQHKQIKASYNTNKQNKYTVKLKKKIITKKNNNNAIAAQTNRLALKNMQLLKPTNVNFLVYTLYCKISSKKKKCLL